MMKHFLFTTTLLFLTTFLMAQPDQSSNNDPYAPAWAEIDSLLQNGLPQSAHDALQTLWGLVQEDYFGDPSLLPNWIKVKIATLEVGKQLEENGEWKAIRQLEEINRLAGQPEKSIYSSYLAEQYYRYWQRVRWQRQGATTQAESEKGDDPTTWSQEDFLEHITGLYLGSLQFTATRNIELIDVQPLIATGAKGTELLPTVYDLLLHRALNYFRNNDAFLNEPAYDPALNQLVLLGAIEDFINFDVEQSSSKSSFGATISLFQEALQWSASERSETEAHLDLNLTRLQLVYEQLTLPTKHQAYEDALMALLAEYAGTSLESEVQRVLMRFKYDRGNYYDADNPSTADLRWYYKDALELAQEIERRFPETPAAKDAAAITSLVKNRALDITTEQVQLPKRDALAQVRFRNVGQVYLRLVPSKPLPNPEQDREILLRNLLKEKGSKNWSVSLPDAGDYRSHTTEIRMPAVAAGKYYVLASADPDFPLEANHTAILEYWVSNLAILLEADQAEGEIGIMVLDRTSGEPIAGAEVGIWEYERRNRENRRPKLVLRETIRTDENGRVLLEGDNINNQVIQAEKGNDQLLLRESQYLNVRRSNNPGRTKLLYFTDRGLYRPGQTLYFKGLLLREGDNQVPEIVPNEKLVVTLFNANRQKVQEMEVTTNRFGSVSGQFKLPSDGLLGQMSLYANPGKNWHYFRVEEYKRPRFEVKIEDLAQEAALNDSVQITGNAMMYAGPPVAEAEVKYRVTRSIRFPWYRSWYRMPYSPPGEQTIISGSTSTGVDGAFDFTFLAQADADPNSPSFPLYTFDVEIEVVDGTGETRSANKPIRLTKYPFQLELSTKAEQDKSAGLSLALGCKNLDEQDVEKEVQLRIQRRNSPNTTYIDRYWPFPDTVSIQERTFRKRLPNYAFHKNELASDWPLGDVVFEETIQLNGSDSVEVNVGNWPVGHYQAELFVVTPEGDTLRTAARFSLNDWAKADFAAGKPLYLKFDNAAAEPGQVADLEIGGNEATQQVWAQWRNRGGQLTQGWVTTTDNLTHPVGEEDRGGLTWQASYVWQNRVFQVQRQCAVPWSNKKLSIHFQTFRSKLYPDQEEEWTIRIDGPDAEAASAEVLASMYDASLDQILPFNWRFSPYYTGVGQATYRPIGFQSINRFIAFPETYVGTPFFQKTYPRLYQPASLAYGGIAGGSRAVPRTYSAPMMEAGEAPSPAPGGRVGSLPTRKVNALAATTAGLQVEGGEPVVNDPEATNPTTTPPPTKVRTNLAETAFFLPELRTDEDGRVVFKFRSPESLTQWKLQVFAHDEQLAYAIDRREVVTQKELMILPNAPRFLREGDRMVFTAKVSNISEQPLVGTATLELFDLASDENLNTAYQLNVPDQAFDLSAGSSQAVSWSIQVPDDANGQLGYRVLAKAGTFSDGEESALPVLTNRVLVTEAQPLFVRAQDRARFKIDGLFAANEKIEHQSFQLHITSNPAWEAIKALPYLQEYPYDCTEQLVNRLLANTIARTVLAEYPQAEEVFEAWRRSADGLKSPLQLNEELKSAALEETPWVMDAQAESLQRERIALLFDQDRLDTELAVGIRRLLERQQPSGAFSWFPSGRENIYMTQYVAEQLTHLREIAFTDLDVLNVVNGLNRAVKFCDGYYLNRYEAWKKDEKNGFVTGPQLVHYLYLRSQNEQVAFPEGHDDMMDYAWEKTTKEWLSYGIFEQALLGQAAVWSAKSDLAERIFASLKERSLYSEDQGRYWRQDYGYYWYQNPIETQAKLIEFFQQMNAPQEDIAAMKIWLLRNKETNRWETTKATAAAVHALLTSGEDWLGETTPLEVRFPKLSETVYEEKLSSAQATAEVGTGAYKIRWDAEEVVPALGEIQLRNRSKAPGWGGLYWQYFQTIDEIEGAGTEGLTVERGLYRKVDEGQGNRLISLDQSPVPGDRITVRLVVRADRDFEFVHLKDLRASGLEPVEQLSQYKFQGGLGYYQQSTDLGTHFFFDYIRKGEYVLEYDLRVFHAGDFSGGLSTIQCMYAPKFTSRSEGVRLEVSNKEE